MAAAPQPDVDVPAALVICAPTFFRSKEDPRFAASMETLRACRAAGFNVLLVDGSPPEAGVAEALESEGARVVREEARGKSNALRQSLRAAGSAFPEAQVFAFQELEKTDFVRCYAQCVPGMLRAPEGESRVWDFCNPARTEESWATYAIEQVHEEKFQNRLMHLISERHGFSRELDWCFGPFLLRREHLQEWLTYPGQTYDAQWGPLISSLRKDPTLVVGTPAVDYQHSPGMKAEPEYVALEELLAEAGQEVPVGVRRTRCERAEELTSMLPSGSHCQGDGGAVCIDGADHSEEGEDVAPLPDIVKSLRSQVAAGDAQLRAEISALRHEVARLSRGLARSSLEGEAT